MSANQELNERELEQVAGGIRSDFRPLQRGWDLGGDIIHYGDRDVFADENERELGSEAQIVQGGSVQGAGGGVGLS